MSFQEAKKLLLEAVDTVIAVANKEKLENPISSVSQPSNKAAVGIKEHNRLFGFQPSKGKNRAKSRSTTSSTKRKVSKSVWKKECICLRDSHQTWKPSPEEKIELARLGLGLKKLEFDTDGSAQHIHSVIIRSFPVLVSSGGYTLMRLAENSHTIVEIEGPDSGLTVVFLKDILNQAKLYLRPLQKDILDEDMQTPAVSFNE